MNVSLCIKMLSYWHGQRQLAALHIKQKAGRPLND